MQHWQRIFHLITFSLVLASAVVGWLGTTSSLDVSKPTASQITQPAESDKPAVENTFPELDSALAAIDTPLQQPLVAPPPREPKPPPKPTEPPQRVVVNLPAELTLVGTVVENGTGKGLFRIGAGCPG